MNTNTPSLRTACGFALAFLLAACTPSTTEMTEQEALDFLYSYMPLPDRVDYDTAFYRQNIQMAMQARREMPWGQTVPEREWRHFVLPVRVNNENLDSSRTVFYHELRDRVRGLSMADAILEVNHWCHEHVTYQPSDERTSSPLATVKSAIGRCGEESTFTVAALRSVGIPARQVYTPRWAHTDDNHAWVEAWADGEWHFLGACEPEAVLDLGWFNAPASRGMLMHTKVFGDYDGPEEVVSRNECYTEINVTANYAPVGEAWVRVVDREGVPVEGAEVEYKVYNYAEFYTVARRSTDAEGISSLQAGKGDLLAWCSNRGRYGFATCHIAQGDTAVLVLDHEAGERFSADIDIVPPVERNTVPPLTDEQRAGNAARLAYEDSLRKAYIATFDTSTPLLAKTRGNHEEIKRFLSLSQPVYQLSVINYWERAQDLLSVLSDKDLRDVDYATLMDALGHTPECHDLPRDFYNRYVLNPRVKNEMIRPHREFLGAELRKEGIGSPVELQKWMADNVQITSDCNPQNLRMTPLGVWRHRVTDETSAAIFFVAACRALGIPARIDPVTNKLQWAMEADKWIDESPSPSLPEVGRGHEATIISLPTSGRAGVGPAYYTHFTLSRMDGGWPVLLNYPEEATYDGLLGGGTTVDAGDYMMVTGTRLANGSVLAHIEVFPAEAGSTVAVPLVMRSDPEQLQVIGSLDSESLYRDSEGTMRSMLSTTGRGYYIIGIITPGDEPTNHILRDISLRRAELEQWGRPILLLFASQSDAERFHREDFPDLPSTVVFGTDTSGAIAAQMPGARPAVQIADTFNRVVYRSNGYTIALGDALLRAIGKL